MYVQGSTSKHSFWGNIIDVKKLWEMYVIIYMETNDHHIELGYTHIICGTILVIIFKVKTSALKQDYIIYIIFSFST